MTNEKNKNKNKNKTPSLDRLMISQHRVAGKGIEFTRKTDNRGGRLSPIQSSNTNLHKKNKIEHKYLQTKPHLKLPQEN